MKRSRLLLMFTCLLLGALMNIGLATGCALVLDPKAPSMWQSMSEEEVQHLWSMYAPPNWPPARGGASMRAFGRELRNAYGSKEEHAIGSMVLVYESGWPVKSFRAIAYAAGGNDPEWTGNITVETRAFTRIVPVSPLWSGLAINTAFHAAIIWMLIRGPIESRRRWRELRNRCGRCGYPRGTSSICTECGSDLTRGWGYAPSADAHEPAPDSSPAHTGSNG